MIKLKYYLDFRFQSIIRVLSNSYVHHGLTKITILLISQKERFQKHFSKHLEYLRLIRIEIPQSIKKWI